MIRILNIDASDAQLYVSISEDGNCIAVESSHEQLNHASLLQPFVEKLMKATNLSFTDLHAVAVMNGPGSYTGLRVALAAAKGYCFALDIPLIGISNLQAIAQNYHNNTKDVTECIALIQPMKKEIIAQYFSQNLYDDTKPMHLKTQEEWRQFSAENTCFVGNLSEETIDFFEIKNVQAQLFDKQIINEMSYAHYTRNINISLNDSEPFYIKATFIN
jgi:tRNA threonylcarbamoyladenosine biosynthesis protein TsaB